MASERRKIVAEVACRDPGCQGMTRQTEDTCNKVERMRHAVARLTGHPLQDIVAIAEEDRPVIRICVREVASR